MRKADRAGDRERLTHVLEAIAGIETLLKLDERNDIHEKAMERYFEIIGEACRAVSKSLRADYPQVPWTNIIALRNVISHEYEKIDVKTLWDVAEHKIPALKHWIEGIIEAIKER